MQWQRVSAWDVVEQTGSDTLVRPTGSAHRLAPLDLSDEPELAKAAEAVDLEDAADS